MRRKERPAREIIRALQDGDPKNVKALVAGLDQWKSASARLTKLESAASNLKKRSLVYGAMSAILWIVAKVDASWTGDPMVVLLAGAWLTVTMYVVWDWVPLALLAFHKGQADESDKAEVTRVRTKARVVSDQGEAAVVESTRAAVAELESE